MAIRAKYMVNGDIPWALELKMVQRGGFRIFSRKPREYVILEKVATKKFFPEILIDGELPEETQRELIRRCQTVYDQFNDPVAFAKTVRYRLKNIALTLSPLQRVFVEEWTAKNVIEDDQSV